MTVVKTRLWGVATATSCQSVTLGRLVLSGSQTAPANGAGTSIFPPGYAFRSKTFDVPGRPFLCSHRR